MEQVKDKSFVSVKVSPALREYILAINAGSDLIVPSYKSRLWGLVKMHLELIPNDYKPVPVGGTPDAVRIALYTSARPVYSLAEDKVVTVHTLYRNHLSETGQRAVAKHLMSEFKSTFRAYMNGALSNNPELEIQDVIDKFCDDYHIEQDKITTEMLRKDWYRFRLRCGASSIIPIENHDL